MADSRRGSRSGLRMSEVMMMKTPRQLHFQKGTDVPNSTLPALLFRGVLAPNSFGKIERFRQTFRRNGWVGIWTDTIYDYTHFHSNAHEVLGIAKGRVHLITGPSCATFKSGKIAPHGDFRTRPPK